MQSLRVSSINLPHLVSILFIFFNSSAHPFDFDLVFDLSTCRFIFFFFFEFCPLV